MLPNPGLAWLATEVPQRIEELAACPDLGPKRIARYGTKWLELLNNA